MAKGDSEDYPLYVTNAQRELQCATSKIKPLSNMSLCITFDNDVLISIPNKSHITILLFNPKWFYYRESGIYESVRVAGIPS